MTRQRLIAEAFIGACRDELRAPKPGNVHDFSPGHRMTATQFIQSADAAVSPLCAPQVRVGARILGAVEATVSTVGANTNLGIILLCAPLAAAAEITPSGLRDAVASVLANLDVADASDAFAAIVRACPAGLGRTNENDVFEPAKVTLLQAMCEAADRDSVARQYATGFSDVFDFGVAVNANALKRWDDANWATLAVYLAFLSEIPDSHIVRKHGADVGTAVRRKAVEVNAQFWAAINPVEMLHDLLSWDATLKATGINPGTSADLTVATLFAYRLQSILQSAHNSD